MIILRKVKEAKSYYPKMMKLIKSQNADILCFEEYADEKNMD